MQDIFARMTLYNLASLLRLHASFMQLKGEYLYRVNDAFAAHIAREFLLGFVSTTKVESLITSFLLPVRPDQPQTRNMRVKRPVSFLAGNYEKDRFYRMAEGLEDVKEGGARCFKCYALRLRETAQMAKKAGYDYFTTTLSISPMKNAAKLNEIGLAAQKEFGVKYLQSDFKKKNGYKRSIELSKEYGLYRQDYCGCEFSQRSSTQ